MAAKGKQSEDTMIDAPDLISLLTPPGCDGCYEMEISPSDTADDDFFLQEQPETDSDENSFDRLQQIVKPAAKENRVLASSPANLQPRLPEKKPTGNELQTPAITAAPVGILAQIGSTADIAGDSMQRIIDEISNCQKCELSQTRNKTVPGIGPDNARLVFIGEAPGADEDASGIPFVGKAGRHLDKILTAAGFKREEVYICNILKCRAHPATGIQPSRKWLLHSPTCNGS
jgi:hypothetical protein